MAEDPLERFIPTTWRCSQYVTIQRWSTGGFRVSVSLPVGGQWHGTHLQAQTFDLACLKAAEAVKWADQVAEGAKNLGLK